MSEELQTSAKFDLSTIDPLLVDNGGRSGIGADIQSYDATTADDMLRKINKAIGAVKWKRAEILLHVYRNKLFISLGCDDFVTYCEGKLGIGERTANYEMSVFKKMVENLEVPKARLEKLEFSKIQEISTKVDNFSVEHWLRLAEDPSKSVRDIREEVRRSEGKLPDATPLTRKVVLNFTETQFELVQEALQVAGDLSKSGSQSVRMVRMCMDFLTSPMLEKARAGEVSATQLEWYIRMLEETFNVKLEVKGQPNV